MKPENVTRAKEICQRIEDLERLAKGEIHVYVDKTHISLPPRILEDIRLTLNVFAGAKIETLHDELNEL